MVVFFLVYQIAILEYIELYTNYFFDCFAGFQGVVFFLKRNIEVQFPCQSHDKYGSY